MSKRYTIRFPDWMADEIERLAAADPYADEKVSRTVRAIIRENFRSRGIAPRGTKRPPLSDNLRDSDVLCLTQTNNEQ
jgi:hypothetical protein